MDFYQPLIKIIDEQIYHSTSLAFIELRNQINDRRLYVLFEDILHCDVNTDHLNSKSVLPIFEQFLSQAQRYIEIQGSKLVDLKIITFIEHLVKEQVQQIAELQEALINEGFQTILISLIENGQSKMVDKLQNQLFSVQQYYNKIIKNIMETKVSLAKIGSLYQADPLEFLNMNKEPNLFQKISEQQNQITALSNLNNILTDQITKSSKNNVYIIKTMKKESQDLRITCQKQKNIIDQTEDQMKEYISKIKELETLLTTKRAIGVEDEQKQITQLQQSNIQLSKNLYKQLDAMDKLAAVVNVPKLRPSQKLVKKAKFQIQKSTNLSIQTNSSVQNQLGNQSLQSDQKFSNSSQTQIVREQLIQQQMNNSELNSIQDIQQGFSDDHQIGEEFDIYIDNLQTVIDTLAFDGAKIITQEEEEQASIYYQQQSQNAQLTDNPQKTETFDIYVQTLESFFSIDFQYGDQDNSNKYRCNTTYQSDQPLKIYDQRSSNQSTLLQNNSTKSPNKVQQSLPRLISNSNNSRNQNYQQLNMEYVLQNSEKNQLPELNQYQMKAQQDRQFNENCLESQQQNGLSAYSITGGSFSPELNNEQNACLLANQQIQQKNIDSVPCQQNSEESQQLFSSSNIYNSNQTVKQQQQQQYSVNDQSSNQYQQESCLFNQVTNQPPMQNQFSQTEIVYLKENQQWDDQSQKIKDPFVGQLFDPTIHEIFTNIAPSLHIDEIKNYYTPFLLQNLNYQLNDEGHMLDQQGNIIKTKLELEKDMYIQSNHRLQKDECFDIHGNIVSISQNGKIIRTHKEISDEHNQRLLVNLQNQDKDDNSNIIRQQDQCTKSLHSEHVQQKENIYQKENIVFKFIYDVFDIHAEETPVEGLQVLLINSLKTLLTSRQREGQVIQKLSDQISSQADVLKEAQQLFNDYMEQRFSKAVQTLSNNVETYSNDITLAIRETNSLLHKQKLKVRIPDYLQTSKDVQKRLQFYEQLARKRASEVLFQQNPRSISVFDRAMSRTTVNICNLNEVVFQQNKFNQRK